MNSPSLQSRRGSRPLLKALAENGSEARVLAIGAAGIDIVGRPTEELVLGVSRQAEIRTTFGGVARNVAETLASLGQPVTLLSVVGKDRAGEALLQQTAASGIDLSRVLITSDYSTSTYLAVLNKYGEIIYALDDMRAIGCLSSDYMRQNVDLFKQCSLLFIDANVSSAALRTIVSLAKRARLPICADPATTNLAHRLLPYLDALYMITPNSSEAALLCGYPIQAYNRKQAVEAAKHLVSEGVEIAIIALGEYGVCYATSETSGSVPALRTKVTDPTGAGDALTASVIFGLLNDIPLDEAIRLGVSAASLTLNYHGAVIPDLTLEILYDHLVI